MPKGIQKPSGLNTVFYEPMAEPEEVRTGYLVKSPPSGPLMHLKQWRCRFFVLMKNKDESYQLNYFKSADNRDEPLGRIELSHISLLSSSPQKLSKWAWVNKTNRCAPDCVLYIRDDERDYFLIGENSCVVDEWFSDLYDALRCRPHELLNPEDLSDDHCVPVSISDPMLRVFSIKKKTEFFMKPGKTEPIKMRPTSEPAKKQPNIWMESPKEMEKPKRPQSDPVQPPLNSLYDHPRNFLQNKTQEVEHARRQSFEYYDYPKNFLRNLNQKSEEELDNNPNKYMTMESVYVTVKEAEKNEEDSPVKSLDTEQCTSGSLMRSLTHVFDKFTTQESTIQPFEEELTAEEGVFNSKEDTIPEEKEILVNQEDLKKHLTLCDVEGKPCINGWTGLSRTTCHFHKGDQILAINDLQTESVQEFENYLSKLLKNQVTLTILRLPGSQPLDSAAISCD